MLKHQKRQAACSLLAGVRLALTRRQLGAQWRETMNAVTDHAARQRFELVEEGKLAFADYRREGDTLVLPHVEADPALRGRGAAGRLMEGMMVIVKERGLKVRPVCSYAVAWLQRHPEYRDLVA